ncbi:MAG: EXLDI protein [Chloroflexi bacterium]|nr:MAG: EXLDI protein [Chloroflexota bacterium]
MPNRTIYVADADLPTFEKAQELAGENLSATIAQALRRFVDAEEAKASGFEEVTVKVGKIAHSYKRFRGRLLAKGRVRDQNEMRRTVYDVYQTVKGKLALYVRGAPNLYETLDELKDNVPLELYEAVAQALKGDPEGVEYLDI